MKSALLRLLSFVAAIGVAVGSGCSDPVQSAQIDALGPETEGGPGPDHRPGQPCVVCHSDGGPASDTPFAIAGTIYKTSAPKADGAENVIVRFVDARGGAPNAPASTGPTGNFYVPLADWPNIAFPIRVGLYNNLKDPPVVTMGSLINREQSCNFCHQPNIDPADLPKDDDQKQHVLDQTASSAGQIYFGTGS